MNTRQRGFSAEQRAAQYLIENGYRIITRNFQSRAGEIDCIAEEKTGTLVFVEVKSSRGPGCGHPFFQVTRAKQAQIVKMARLYLAQQGLTGRACRFDLIAVRGETIEHLKNAFIAGY